MKVEQLRPLLAKIAKRENIVEERVELEHLMQNPERLTARGPKAREDRKREEDMQRRVKNLEKITKEVSQRCVVASFFICDSSCVCPQLLGHISTWEESNDGSPFLYAVSERVNECTDLNLWDAELGECSCHSDIVCTGPAVRRSRGRTRGVLHRGRRAVLFLIHY